MIAWRLAPGPVVNRQEVICRFKPVHWSGASDGAVGVMPFVVVLPARQGLGSLGWVLVRPAIDPLTQCRLDEPLGLAIGLRPVRPGEVVSYAQRLAGRSELPRTERLPAKPLHGCLRSDTMAAPAWAASRPSKVICLTISIRRAKVGEPSEDPVAKK